MHLFVGIILLKHTISYSEQTLNGPLKCFNANKNWILGWYRDKAIEIPVNSSWSGRLVAFADYGQANSASNENVLLRIGDDVFVQYNRAKGFNAGTGQNRDKVVLVSGEATESVSSYVLAGLGENESFSRNGVTFEVCSLVGGPTDFADVGIYPTGAPSTCASTAISDRCSEAPMLSVGTYFGSTSDATPDSDEISSCSSSMSPGVWYRVVGTGGGMTADTCDNATTYDSRLSVFVGRCGSLACIGSNDDGCGLRSSVSWSSQAGVEYKILVYGYSDHSGSFGLTIRQVTDQASPRPTTHPSVGPSLAPSTGRPSLATIPTRPSNDNCVGATSISFGTYSGSTIDATTDDDESDTCVSSHSPGVWYRVIGTGGLLNVNTCGPQTNFDTFLSVFEGACGNLRCLGTNDDSCNLSSSVTWESELGVEYKVLVFGFGDKFGSFTLHFPAPATPAPKPSATNAPVTRSPVGFPTPPSPGHTPCSVCGQGMVVTLPNIIIDIPTFGETSCAQLEAAGLGGHIEERFCPLVLSFSAPCGCEPSSAESRVTNAPVTNDPVGVPIPTPPSPGFPPCSVCGEGMVVTLPSVVVDIPTYGETSCAQFQAAGLGGFIEEQFCPVVLAFSEPCGCAPL